MDARVLQSLCEQVRSGSRAVGDHILIAIEQGVRDATLCYERGPSHIPPDEIIDGLWALGWLIYEASWSQVSLADSRFETADEATRLRGVKALATVSRISSAYRRMPWPEFAPRGLGVIRSEALLESKKDTDEGYRTAWTLHRDAMRRYETYSVSVRSAPKRYELALLEIMVQLGLAETGTACREAERIIGRWAEEVSDGVFDPAKEDLIVERLFRALEAGVQIGNRALRTVDYVASEFGLQGTVSADRLALDTARRNPGIMTSRAALSAVPLCREMERMGKLVPGGEGTWSEYSVMLLGAARDALGAVAKPVLRGRQSVPLVADHARSVVQLMLHLAFVSPGTAVPAGFDFAECVRAGRLDGDRVERLSEWLAEIVVTNRNDGSVDSGKRGNANVIGSATLPSFIRSVSVGCRNQCGVDYLDWRVRWFELDRYFDEGQDRKVRVERALSDALGVPVSLDENPPEPGQS